MNLKYRNIAAAGMLALSMGGAAAVLTTGPTMASATTVAVQHGRQLPSWFHWAYASKHARADCHGGGSAILVWQWDSDQSWVFCRNGNVLTP